MQSHGRWHLLALQGKHVNLRLTSANTASRQQLLNYPVKQATRLNRFFPSLVHHESTATCYFMDSSGHSHPNYERSLVP